MKSVERYGIWDCKISKRRTEYIIYKFDEELCKG